MLQKIITRIVPDYSDAKDVLMSANASDVHRFGRYLTRRRSIAHKQGGWRRKEHVRVEHCTWDGVAPTVHRAPNITIGIDGNNNVVVDSAEHSRGCKPPIHTSCIANAITWPTNFLP